MKHTTTIAPTRSTPRGGAPALGLGRSSSIFLGVVLVLSLLSAFSPRVLADEGAKAASTAFSSLVKKATEGDLAGASKLIFDPANPAGGEVFAQSLVDLLKEGAVSLKVHKSKSKGDYAILVVETRQIGARTPAYQPMVMRKTKEGWRMLASADGKARKAFQFKDSELEAMAFLGKWATELIDGLTFQNFKELFDEAMESATKRTQGAKAGSEPSKSFESFSQSLVGGDLTTALSWFSGLDVLPAGTKNNLLKTLHSLSTTVSGGQVKLLYVDSKVDGNRAVVLSELKGPLKPGVRDKGSFYPYLLLKRGGEWRFLAARQISEAEQKIYKLTKEEMSGLEGLGKWTQEKLSTLALAKINEQFAFAKKRASTRVQLRGDRPTTPDETMIAFFDALKKRNISEAHSWLAQSEAFEGKTREYILDFLYELSGQLSTGRTTIKPVLAPSSGRCALMVVKAQSKESGAAASRSLPAYDEFLPMIKQGGEWRIIHDASLNGSTAKAHGLTREDSASYAKLRRQMQREIDKLCLTDLAPISGQALKRGQELVPFLKSTPEECFLDLVNAGRKNDFPRMLLWLAEADCITHYDRMNFLSEFHKFSAGVPPTLRAGKEILAHRDGNVALLVVSMESLVQGVLIWKSTEGWRILPHPDYRDKSRSRHHLSGEFLKSYAFNEADRKSFESVAKWLDDALSTKEEEKSAPAPGKAAPGGAAPGGAAAGKGK